MEDEERPIWRDEEEFIESVDPEDPPPSYLVNEYGGDHRQIMPEC